MNPLIVEIRLIFFIEPQSNKVIVIIHGLRFVKLVSLGWPDTYQFRTSKFFEHFPKLPHRIEKVIGVTTCIPGAPAAAAATTTLTLEGTNGEAGVSVTPRPRTTSVR